MRHGKAKRSWKERSKPHLRRYHAEYYLERRTAKIEQEMSTVKALMGQPGGDKAELRLRLADLRVKLGRAILQKGKLKDAV